MTNDPRFLTTSEVIEIHDQEIATAVGLSGVRDIKALESALGAPQASFGGQFIMDIFEMAATYINSIALNHPFLDGNKRTALATSLTFLFINGFEIDEHYDVELAEKTLDLVARKITKSDLAQHLKSRSKEIR
ncbi:MAG: type II toxin-antitoxin system death-on-curing family toxin [Chitinispirillaceae bacterium]|jgi:death-on-curing protein